MTQVSVRRGVLYVSVAAAAWGTGGAAGSLLFQSTSLGPFGVSLWRYLLGALFLITIVRRRPGTHRRLLLVGVGMAIYQTAYFGAIATSGVAIATVVTMGATPLFTAVGGRLFLGERLDRVGTACVGAALLGLVVLTAGSSGAGPEATATLAGVGLALLSAAGYAAVTLHSRRHHDDPYGTAVGGFAIGALCLAPFAMTEGIVPQVTLPTVALLLYLGAVPTALAYGLYFRSLSALKATTVSVISLGEAVGAAALGVLLFGERLTALTAAGCLVLLGAVVVLTVHERG
ncbi:MULTISPECIES: DMT family transporter [Nonomuraea]|uniref:DME family drug/metabolite transporter n=4 Tax=Nonomuraea TaxID=83681 RepID=A0A7W5VCJ6_9ACTN|nr:EamA family transporter [Nonomuraea dietziae]MBB3731120.1 DME family drug/metabolite transporter [Nonomuraea dietziae]